MSRRRTLPRGYGPALDSEACASEIAFRFTSCCLRGGLRKNSSTLKASAARCAIPGLPREKSWEEFPVGNSVGISAAKPASLLSVSDTPTVFQKTYSVGAQPSFQSL